MVHDEPLRLAVFDLDGTLVDSLGVIVGAMAHAARAREVPARPAAEVRRVIGLPLEEAIARLFPQADDGEVEIMTAAYKDSVLALRAAGQAHEPLYPGARAALDALDDGGWLLGIATGKPRRGLESSLVPHGLLDRFVTLQTADLGPGKPHPGMLVRAMSEAGTDPTFTVMIGDTTYDMEMARSAGTHAVGVAWGYHNDDELKAAGAHRIVRSFGELPNALNNLMERA